MGLCVFFLKVEFIFLHRRPPFPKPYVNYIFTKIGIFPADTVEHGVYSMHVFWCGKLEIILFLFL